MERHFMIYVFNKNCKVRNAGGFPPPFIFHGKNALGKIYIVSGKDETDALNYFCSQMPEEAKQKFTVMVRGETDEDGLLI